ncbi:MAG: hypothetical protein KDA52_06635 [Planctomycetaceae bacterium]|nr:hypothetical protein [Planctomycetaceae bacterium]
MSLNPLSGDDAGAPLKPAPTAGAPMCLEEPEHWSAQPNLVQGNELICSRFLRFQTPDGRSINARMFLIEFHARNLKFLDDQPVEEIIKRQAIPSRIACIGHEISVDEDYAPDFDVPTEFVKALGECAYNVDLGSLKCFVRTTAPSTN